jgi:hypothetical protein
MLTSRMASHARRSTRHRTRVEESAFQRKSSTTTSTAPNGSGNSPCLRARTPPVGGRRASTPGCYTPHPTSSRCAQRRPRRAGGAGAALKLSGSQTGAMPTAPPTRPPAPPPPRAPACVKAVSQMVGKLSSLPARLWRRAGRPAAKPAGDGWPQALDLALVQAWRRQSIPHHRATQCAPSHRRRAPISASANHPAPFTACEWLCHAGRACVIQSEGGKRCLAFAGGVLAWCASFPALP